jgi:hypothetical protein
MTREPNPQQASSYLGLVLRLRGAKAADNVGCEPRNHSFFPINIDPNAPVARPRVCYVWFTLGVGALRCPRSRVQPSPAGCGAGVRVYAPLAAVTADAGVATRLNARHVDSELSQLGLGTVGGSPQRALRLVGRPFSPTITRRHRERERTSARSRTGRSSSRSLSEQRPFLILTVKR